MRKFLPASAQHEHSRLSGIKHLLLVVNKVCPHKPDNTFILAYWLPSPSSSLLWWNWKGVLLTTEIHLWAALVQLVHRGHSIISSRHSKIRLLKSRVIKKSGRKATGVRELQPGDQRYSSENTDKNDGRWKRRMRMLCLSECQVWSRDSMGLCGDLPKFLHSNLV